MKQFFTSIFFLFVFFSNGATYYVDINGNDSNTGTLLSAPLKTIAAAVSKVQPGDSILIRGGIHYYNQSIYISKSGTERDTCFLFAYPGERPVLDFSGTQSGKRAIILIPFYRQICSIKFFVYNS